MGLDLGLYEKKSGGGLCGSGLGSVGEEEWRGFMWVWTWVSRRRRVEGVYVGLDLGL